MLDFFKDLFRHIYHNIQDYSKVLLLIALGLLFSFLLLSGFIELIDAVFDQEMKHFDQAVANFIFRLRSDDLTIFFKTITLIGNRNSWIIQLAFLAILFFILKNDWYITVKAIIVLGIGSAINHTLKFLLSRDRPAEMLIKASSASFPSGHAMSAMAFYGFIIYLAWKYIPNPLFKWSTIIFVSILTLLIGISRVYLGVHFATDVIAGFIGGLIWLMISIVVFEGYSIVKRIITEMRE